jgi:hypothetical protein
MSLVTGRYFSNAIVGTPQVGADVNVHEVHAAPKFPIGQGFTRADGALFRYGCASTGITAGTLVAPTFATSGVVLTSNAIIAPASAVAVSGDSLKPGAKGSRFLEITIATVTANQYQGGYLIVSSGTGLGYTYRIVGNTATDNPATGNIRIELKEKIAVAFDATTDVCIAPSMWHDVAAAGATNGSVCGVAMSTTVTTTYPWGWFCTRGVVGMLQDGAWTTGYNVVKSTAGGAITWTTLLASNPIIGYCITNAGDGVRGPAFIKIE